MRMKQPESLKAMVDEDGDRQLNNNFTSYNSTTFDHHNVWFQVSSSNGDNVGTKDEHRERG